MNIIGQKNIIEWVDVLKQSNLEPPHFIVFIGGRGSGKRTLAKYIAKTFYYKYTEVGIKVDDVRSVIDTAYKNKNSSMNVLYCFADADTMRNEAKNAMLKITEEPPKNAWFILTVRDSNSLLATIQSRAMVINMAFYSVDELTTYAIENNYSWGRECVNLGIAKTPYDVATLDSYGKEFLDYVGLVLDNIRYVESANAFKSGNKLALKKDGEGYDLQLFFDAFISECVNRIKETKGDLGSCVTYAEEIKITSDFANVVNKLGVNKQQLYDNWVLYIRSV